MTKMLHVNRPSRFQRIGFGVNRLSGCGVPASARIQEPLSRKWTCPLCPHGQMTMTLHIYGLRRFQWTWILEWIGPVVAEFRCPQDFKSHYYTHGLAHYAPMGKKHYVVHIQAKTWSRTWSRVSRPYGHRVLTTVRFQGHLSCPWTRPLCPNVQMTSASHMYRPRRFEWPRFGVNRPVWFREP